MAKNNNLPDFLTDVANAIRARKGTTGAINPQNFASEILSIPAGGGRISSDAVILGSGEEYNVFPQSNTFGAVSFYVDDGSIGVENEGIVVIYVGSSRVRTIHFGPGAIIEFSVMRVDHGTINVDGTSHNGETVRVKWEQEVETSDEIELDIQSATFEI